MKPKLLIIELWGVGDLAVATPFLRAAAEKFAVTLLAKPHALELRPRLWPEVKVVTINAPWTAFHGKYRLLEWPWRELTALRNKLAAEKFDFAVSARHDPRDHLLMYAVGADRRVGFPRAGSAMFLTDPLDLPKDSVHRYDFWRDAAARLGFSLPSRSGLSFPSARAGKTVLVHSGAGQAVRVWPLERCLKLVHRLRQDDYQVHVACDPNQRDWWLAAGESKVSTPRTVKELFESLDSSAVFVGNDSGAGHLAAIAGMPTFTIFGPQLPERFAPLHQAAKWVEGRPCPYKPCSDYCRFPTPHCIDNITEEEVGAAVMTFLKELAAAAQENSLPTGKPSGQDVA